MQVTSKSTAQMVPGRTPAQKNEPKADAKRGRFRQDYKVAETVKLAERR
jgi:hypothetical protein